MSKPAVPRKSGFRGYITSRPINGDRTPQHVQNLVIRDYACRYGLAFKLSATEYAMTNCYVMLNGVLNELPSLDGIIVYSLFMLPEDAAERRRIYRRVIEAGATLHAAVEEFRVADEADLARIEDVWKINRALAQAPKSLEPYAE